MTYFEQLGANSKHLKTLNLFAYDTMRTYRQNPGQYLQLKPAQQKKLELITIADMASKQAVVPYADMMQALEIQDQRQLEDKIIDCIYNELLKGRLDQKKSCLHVASTYGRDVQDNAVNSILARLQDWDSRLAGAQSFMEQQMAACTENVHSNYTQQVESEVNYLKELNRALLNQAKGGQDAVGAENEHASFGGMR